MKKMISLTCLLAMFMLVCVAHGNNGGNTSMKVNHTMDLNQASSYFLSMVAKDTFPRSTEPAYYAVYSLQALKGKLPMEVRKKIVTFIISCQGADGGVSSNPNPGQKTDINSTYYALKTLYLLGAMRKIDKEKAVTFLVSHIAADGGFRPNNQKGATSTLTATANGIRSLTMLKAEGKLDLRKTKPYLMAFKETGSGFAMHRGKKATIEATAMVIQSLHAVGPIYKNVHDDVVSFLRATPYGGDIEEAKTDTLPNVKAISEVLDTLHQLRAFKQVNQEKVFGFVQSTYIAANGGFAPRPGLDATPQSTYHALLCLAKLGKLTDPIQIIVERECH